MRRVPLVTPTREERSGAFIYFGGVAQWLERGLHKAEVGGSIPPIATKIVTYS